MRFGTDELIWKAMLGLSEVAEQHLHTPAPPSFLLRFTLAFLFEATGADSSKKWVFDAFWKAVREPERKGGLSLRARDVETAMKGLCHVVGWHHSTLIDQLDAARKPKE